jgi:hypothetical protein
MKKYTVFSPFVTQKISLSEFSAASPHFSELVRQRRAQGPDARQALRDRQRGGVGEGSGREGVAAGGNNAYPFMLLAAAAAAAALFIVPSHPRGLAQVEQREEVGYGGSSGRRGRRERRQR